MLGEEITHGVSGGNRCWSTAHSQNEIGSDCCPSRVTDFTADGGFDAKVSAARLQWVSLNELSGLFAAGGTGEFFSIGYDEYDVAVSLDRRREFEKACAGAGRGRLWHAHGCGPRQARRQGRAAGLLVLPHY